MPPRQDHHHMSALNRKGCWSSCICTMGQPHVWHVANYKWTCGKSYFFKIFRAVCPCDDLAQKCPEGAAE